MLHDVRTELARPRHKVGTRHGEVSVPAMDRLRLRAAMQVPLGTTMIAGGAGSKGRRQRLLVRTRRRRASR